jgi:hypothetical protein
VVGDPAVALPVVGDAGDVGVGVIVPVVLAVPVVPAVPVDPVAVPVEPVVPAVPVADPVPVAVPVGGGVPVAPVAVPFVAGGTAPLVICPGAAVPGLPVVTLDKVNGSVDDVPPPTHPIRVIVCGVDDPVADPGWVVGVCVLWPAKAAAAQANANPVSRGVFMNVPP